MIYYKGRDRKRMNDGHLLPLKTEPLTTTVTEGGEMTTGYYNIMCLDRATCFPWSIAGVDLGRVSPYR